jgi:hypothetical protein
LAVEFADAVTNGVDGIVKPQDTFPEVAALATGVMVTDAPLTKFDSTAFIWEITLRFPSTTH